MTEAVSFNMGDFVAAVYILGVSILVPAIIVFISYKIIKRSEKRANERLSLEQENVVVLKKQIEDLNERVNVIEEMVRKAK